DGVAVVLLLGLRMRADRDRGPANRRVAASVIGSGPTFGLTATAVDPVRGFVLGAVVTPIDDQIAVPIDADKDAGAGNLGRLIDSRPVLELFERLLDLAEALVDLIGQFVGLAILRLEFVILLA